MIVKILSGCSGCGKSTYALDDRNHEKGEVYVVSTDYSFLNRETGVYEFDRDKLSEYHSRSLTSFIELINDPSIDPTATVIIDNTNIYLWEWSAYLAAARVCSRVVRIEFHAWVVHPGEVTLCYLMNTHGVPFEVIEKMAAEQEFLKDIPTSDVIHFLHDIHTEEDNA